MIPIYGFCSLAPSGVCLGGVLQTTPWGAACGKSMWDSHVWQDDASDPIRKLFWGKKNTPLPGCELTPKGTMSPSCLPTDQPTYLFIPFICPVPFAWNTTFLCITQRKRSHQCKLSDEIFPKRKQECGPTRGNNLVWYEQVFFHSFFSLLFPPSDLILCYMHLHKAVWSWVIGLASMFSSQLWCLWHLSMFKSHN